MKNRFFQKMISVLVALALLTGSLAGNVLATPVYAAEAAPDPLTEEAAAMVGESATPEEAAAMVDEAAIPEEAESSEENAATEQAEEPAEDPSSESAPDPDAESTPDLPGTVSSGASGKYISDVFIAYGKTVEDAEEWLIANGWEPLKGKNNFNAGKASYWDDPVAAVMGIRRTDNAKEAITDLAIMNMKGGYSIPDYEDLVREKKTEIDEFINAFMPIIDEYRDNYNGKGSPQGKRRAELAYTLLNKFTDGSPAERYPANDTGLPLGELLLEPMRNEEGGEAGGDLQQIILESSGPAVLAIEQALALAADPAGDTWLDRLSGITMEKMINNVGEYVPEAAGQDLPHSSAGQFLDQTFGDVASKMISQWKEINEKMLWYEDFNNAYDLWQYDDESDEDYEIRYANAMQDLQSNPDIDQDYLDTYDAYSILYWGLYEVDYPGTWGDTLGDFFNPAEDTSYVFDTENYIPLAAAMSKGQRRSLDLISLYSLVMLGLVGDGGIESLLPDLDELLGDAVSVSVYSGVNRGIFRNGVALTSEALMMKSRGYDPFNEIFDFAGAYNILCYSTAVIGIGVMAAGMTMMLKGASGQSHYYRLAQSYRQSIETSKKAMTEYFQKFNDPEYIGWGPVEKYGREYYANAIEKTKTDIEKYTNYVDKYEKKAAEFDKPAATGRTLMVIGGAILITAAIVKGYQVYKYYQKEFTPIPRMIVDEADIVSYVDNGDGTTTKKIDFDSFVYYEAVRCNRDKDNKIGDWQDGVEDYEKWGCGDVADLNADIGQEWLALYAVRSPRKGNPILADTLIMQYGSDKQPAGTTKALHFFTFTHTADIGDTAYCYNNDKNGIYFFWHEDTGAYDVPAETASVFTTGYMALAVFGGLIIGILGTTLVLYPRRKRALHKA